MSTSTVFLYVTARKAGRGGSKTLPEIWATLISQLCLHSRYRHSALGHAGNIHVMSTGLNQKKKAYGVTHSWRYMNSGTLEIDAKGPHFHVTSWSDYSSLLRSFSFGSAESNRAITSKGSTRNLCATAVLLYTNPKKKVSRG